jgi:two-component system, NtrC family, response regulator GlrR
VDDDIEPLIRRLRDSRALGKLVGHAPGFAKAVAQLPAAARSDAAVLISGETGTGKELAARAIHYLSNRAPSPFVAVNCGSLSDGLLEDELFGHEPGAFTDAKRRRPGLLAQAGRGTLFLDEVETLTERGQVTLLRVLQDRTFRPLGSSGEERAPVRFVAATNAALWPRVQAGTFRADLYYRLCVFSINLPPLRERREDILTLAAHFLEKHLPSERAPLALSPAACAALLVFDWPGNVRELENAMIRACLVTTADTIEAADLGLPGQAPTAASVGTATGQTFRGLKRGVVDAFEREYLTRLLSEHQGNITHAARAAGKDRRDFGRLLKKHHIDPTSFAPVADLGA